MRSTSAPTHEIGIRPARRAREAGWTGRMEGESRSAEREAQALRGLSDLVEPPVETSLDVIERVAAVFRMGSIHTW